LGRWTTKDKWHEKATPFKTIVKRVAVDIVRDARKKTFIPIVPVGKKREREVYVAEKKKELAVEGGTVRVKEK